MHEMQSILEAIMNGCGEFILDRNLLTLEQLRQVKEFLDRRYPGAFHTGAFHQDTTIEKDILAGYSITFVDTRTTSAVLLKDYVSAEVGGGYALYADPKLLASRNISEAQFQADAKELGALLGLKPCGAASRPGSQLPPDLPPGPH